MSVNLTNLNEQEKNRFRNSIQLIDKLFIKETREEVIDTFLERVGNVSLLESTTLGEEAGYIEETENENEYNIAYEKYNPLNSTKSLHQSIHELIHILGTPNTKEVSSKNSGKECFGGLEIIQSENGHCIYYGYAINEGCDELLSKIALSQLRTSNYNADDVIMSNKVDFKSGYKIVTPLVRLLAFSMNNEFNVDYEELVKKDLGLINRKVTFQGYNGEYQTQTNDLFYGMAVDPLYTEKKYNLYTKEDEYKKMNLKLDEALVGKKWNTNLIKEIMISISNMFYNKTYIYLENNLITKELYDKLLYSYEFLLEEIVKFYSINYNVEIQFSKDEKEQMQESYRETKIRLYT